MTMILQRVMGSLKGKTNKSILIRDWISCDVHITPDLVKDFARVTGDVNPIHLDAAEGQKSRFGQRVVHGLLSASLFPTLFSLALPGAVYISQELKFDRPVYYNDTVRARIVVDQIRAIRKNELDECLLVCTTTVYKVNDDSNDDNDRVVAESSASPAEPEVSTRVVAGKAKVLI